LIPFLLDPITAVIPVYIPSAIDSIFQTALDHSRASIRLGCGRWISPAKHLILGRGWGRRFSASEFQPTILVAVVLTLGMAVIGVWIGGRAEDGILQRAASETVLNMDSIIKPLVQDLADHATLPPTAKEALSAVLMDRALGQDVVAIKIWSPVGMVVFSNRPEITGRTYPLFSNLERAFGGSVVAEFDDLEGEENEFERSLGKALLEIYAPVRQTGTNRIIAVAEFYEIHESLESQLRDSRLQIRAAVGSLTVAMIAIVSIIMLKQKRKALERRVVELSQLLAENKELQDKIRNGHRRMAEINEQFLRRVSAELHDAPAQLIGYALLRVGALQRRQERLEALVQLTASPDTARMADDVEKIHDALTESLNEIRAISSGLAPPELSPLTLAEALRMAAGRHVARTGMTVDCHIGDLPEAIDPALKICLYRFAQEGLSNAFRHAGGRGQAIHAHCHDHILTVAVCDDGAAPDYVRTPSGSGGLGLIGLQGRVESLGGDFEFQSEPAQGTRLSARFNLSRLEFDHA
jgi:signal transduction histidine kinase